MFSVYEAQSLLLLSVYYGFVGDLMPFPAKRLEEFFERLEEFDNLVVFGNLFRYLKKNT